MTRNQEYALSMIGMLKKGMDAEVIYNASNDSTTIVYGETEAKMLGISNTTDVEQAEIDYNEPFEIVKELIAITIMAALLTLSLLLILYCLREVMLK